MPGVVYQTVRGRLRGPAPDNREAIVRILRAISVSAALDLIYMAVFAGVIIRAVTEPGNLQQFARQLALLALACTVVIPAVLAAMAHFCSAWRRRGFKRAFTNFWQHDTVPTAWDWFGNARSSGYIRVLTKENKWIGGWAGPNSYISSHPEPRDIYIDRVYELDKNGAFRGAVSNGRASMWIRCDDVQLVQFIADQATAILSQPQEVDQEQVNDD
jgi:hypothetical protein